MDAIFLYVYKLRRMKRYILCILLSTAIISCEKSIPYFTSNNSGFITGKESVQLNSSKAIVSVKASYYDHLFTQYNSGSWTGGDVATSTLLPDGRTFWLFGDSFVDTVFSDRRRPLKPFIHNSIVTTSALGKFDTYYKGSAALPISFFDTTYPIILWPSCALVNLENNSLFVIMVTIKLLQGGGIFGFQSVGNTIGELSLPGLTLKRQFTFSNSSIIDWSSAVFQENGFVYVYGAESEGYDKFVHVCRTSVDHPFKGVEYFNGTKWVSSMTNSARLLKGVSEQYSFFKYKNKYYLLSQESTFFSADIYLWDAASPTGPFSNKRKVYHTPETAGNIITYNATAHPELIVDDMLLVGYCNNSIQGNDIYSNADNYRPHFIWVNNWR